MARYNEILTGRYNRLAQKLFSQKGPASLVALNDEISAVLPLFFGVENRYLETWDLFGAQATTVATVGQLGAIRLRNPSGSNVIAILEMVTAFSNTAAADQPGFQRGTVTADLANVPALTNARIDPRGRSAPTLVLSQDGVAPTALAVTLMVKNFPINQSVEFITFENQEYPLLPGEAIQIQSNVLNQQIRASFRWRERLLEESERA